MRISKPVLTDAEVVRQMREAASPNEGAGAVQARIDAVLAERRARREALQAEYNKGCAAPRPAAEIVNQAKLYPVKEHKGPVTAVYQPSASAVRKSGNGDMLAYAKAREQGKA